MLLPRIYPITDTRISGLSHLEQVSRLADGGARFIQLREKYASPRVFYEAACEVMRFARERDITIVINDRVDIALAVRADGVHLGQDDIPPRAARRLLGTAAVIGYSTHSIEQARLAVELPIDYVAYGPIFKTITKENPDEVVGLGRLGELPAFVGSMPIVAIGGINAERLAEVLNTGADSAAMIGAILADPIRIAESYEYLTGLAERS